MNKIGELYPGYKYIDYFQCMTHNDAVSRDSKLEYLNLCIWQLKIQSLNTYKLQKLVNESNVCTTNLIQNPSLLPLLQCNVQQKSVPCPLDGIHLLEPLFEHIQSADWGGV